MPLLIPAWDFQPIRLDNTPCLLFNPCTKATSQMGKEKKRKERYNRNRRGKGGREGDGEREIVLRLHPDQREC